MTLPTPSDDDPRTMLRDIIAVQIQEGMRWSVDPDWADLLSDHAAVEMCLLAAQALEKHRRYNGYVR